MPSFLAGTLLLLSLSLSGTTQAALLDCSALSGSVADRVTNNAGCQILSPLDGAAADFTAGDPSSWLVNTAGGTGFFGFSDWLFDGRWTSPGTNSSTLASFDGNRHSGQWALDAEWEYGDLLFLFNHGSGTNLVGFLMTGMSGSYNSPFTQPPFDYPGMATRNISHISVYYRSGAAGTVPEPRTMLLMGLGLGLLGLVLRRNRRLGPSSPV
ncbi:MULTISPECIES: PEP-CTERM sorting domain-containing protein [unclassified Thioalkalivibrio]|uniref:PEP-CTERM sorting domain-containing protein n=1 Tax=unclassified Thioalkalivibrio TaxID=2621013 RepID=UPI000477EED1|nr:MULTISPECIES: PEP-CTERM sorting domain-containing protein [unclassified Thioalkalivibrio]